MLSLGLHIPVGPRGCTGGNRGQFARTVGPADVHRLRKGTQHHHPAQPHQRTKHGRRPEDGQGRMVPQPERKREPAHREPTEHQQWHHHQRRQHHDEPEQDVVQRQLRHRRQLDALQRRKPRERHQATEAEQPYRRADHCRERKLHSGKHHATLHADTLRRRSREGERRHPGSEPRHLRTGQATV